jgi:hypothetical protein
MTGKYAPLFDWLKARGQAVQLVSLPFREVERLLGGPLPRSARTHRAWWANAVSGGHVWAAAWLQAGWRVAHVERQGGWVRFERAA